MIAFTALASDRIVGISCIALAAVYLISLTYWYPRTTEFTGFQTGSWLRPLVAVALLAQVASVLPLIALGSASLFAPARRKLLLPIVLLGSITTVCILAYYFARMLVVFAWTGELLRFGAQNDVGIALFLIALIGQLSILWRVRSHHRNNFFF